MISLGWVTHQWGKLTFFGGESMTFGAIFHPRILYNLLWCQGKHSQKLWNGIERKLSKASLCFAFNDIPNLKGEMYIFKMHGFNCILVAQDRIYLVKLCVSWKIKSTALEKMLHNAKSESSSYQSSHCYCFCCFHCCCFCWSCCCCCCCCCHCCCWCFHCYHYCCCRFWLFSSLLSECGIWRRCDGVTLGAT